MYADSATEAEIFAAVDRFFDHLGNARPEAADCFLQEDDVALHGSERSESAFGPDGIRTLLAKLFAEMGPARFTFGKRRASVSGNVAWFTAEAEVAIGGVVVAPYRVTGILEKRDNVWFWRLFNGSEPQPDRV